MPTMKRRTSLLGVWFLTGLPKIIFKGKDPYDPLSWTNAVHFKFEGYDTEPFWDQDGKVYITGAHAWQVRYVEEGRLSKQAAFRV
jgi:hypothetical protein